jgi:RsiW-degrading membrane proteinase PrsW (M82 family)
LEEVLIFRGLTSPAGHLAWTGIVAAVLWRERLRAGRPNGRVLGAFLTAVLLHALWDTVAGVKSSGAAGYSVGWLLSLFVAVASLVLLIRRVREARRASPA